MSRFIDFRFFIVAVKTALICSGIQGFASEAEKPEPITREAFIAKLQSSTISELPDLTNLSGTSLAVAIDMVKAGATFILYNDSGATRVFFNEHLPESLKTIRIVAAHAQVGGIVNDGEWNWYIKNGAGEHVEITDESERKRIIDYVNESSDKENIHSLNL